VAASAMSILVMGGCSDLTVPGEMLLSTDELLILPFQAGTPQPEAASFWVYNERQIVHLMVHPDQFNNPYLELTFPVGSLATLHGTTLLDSDSVLVTVSPWNGRYGFTLSPNDLEFRLDATPTAKLRFAVYADPSIADQSAKYNSPAEYAAALDIWREVTVATWQVASNSTPTSSDAVTAKMETPGEYVLAAPR
jgi:hypothetical protein